MKRSLLIALILALAIAVPAFAQQLTVVSTQSYNKLVNLYGSQPLTLQPYEQIDSFTIAGGANHYTTYIINAALEGGTTIADSYDYPLSPAPMVQGSLWIMVKLDGAPIVIQNAALTNTPAPPVGSNQIASESFSLATTAQDLGELLGSLTSSASSGENIPLYIPLNNLTAGDHTVTVYASLGASAVDVTPPARGYVLGTISWFERIVD
jgi:hypothetical protein